MAEQTPPPDNSWPPGGGAGERYYGPWTPPPAPAAPVAVPPGRRTPRPSAVVGLAAATAVLVGGGAGYGGARLAQTSPDAAAPAPTVATSPAAEPTATEPPPPPPAVANTVAIAERTLPGTVMIKVGDGTGSGFVLDDDGRILTNNHVVAGAADGDKITVVFAGGRRETAKLVGRSASYDLAVVKVKASDRLRPLELGASDGIAVGQTVVAVGSPLGLPGTVTQGIVSARDRAVVVNGDAEADAPSAYINAIQTDAPINPGNSGGPLVDAGARVVGINSAILTLGAARGASGNIGLGFAIPIDQARVIADQLIDKGKASYPVLGASLRSSSRGVVVTSVEDGGPADKAGLREDDLITKVDDRAVTEMNELIVEIRARRPGQTVTVHYTRDEVKKQVRIKLGSRVG